MEQDELDLLLEGIERLIETLDERESHVEQNA
jgi:hypothetical protein